MHLVEWSTCGVSYEKIVANASNIEHLVCVCVLWTAAQQIDRWHSIRISNRDACALVFNFDMLRSYLVVVNHTEYKPQKKNPSNVLRESGRVTGFPNLKR